MAIQTETQLTRERRELERAWNDARGVRYRTRFLEPLLESAVALRKSMEKFEAELPSSIRSCDWS